MLAVIVSWKTLEKWGHDHGELRERDHRLFVAIKSLFEGNVNTNILLFMGLYTKSNVPKNIISSTKSAPLDAT